MATARAAGIQAPKRTSEWVTFRHTVPLDWVDWRVEVVDEDVKVTAEAETVWKTGMDIEAITAVSAALINAYDMLAPLGKEFEMTSVRVVETRGGPARYRQHFEHDLQAAVLVISDATYAGDREDRSGQAIRRFLEEYPVSIATYDLLPDDRDRIQAYVKEKAADPARKLERGAGVAGSPLPWPSSHLSHALGRSRKKPAARHGSSARR